MDGGGSLAVMALPDREESPQGERTGGAVAFWSAAITDGGAEPEPIVQLLAQRRIERMLERLGMSRGRRRELVIQNCMTRAVAAWRDHPRTDLSALALEQVEDALGQWFAFVIGAESLGEQSPLLIGRAAFESCQATRRWPGVLLTYDQLPPAFVEAMRAAQVQPTPAELPGNMLEQSLESWSPRELLTRALGRWNRGWAGPAAPVG